MNKISVLIRSVTIAFAFCILAGFVNSTERQARELNSGTILTSEGWTIETQSDAGPLVES